MRICLALIVLSGLLVTGCAVQTKDIDIANDTGKAVMELDYRDFDQAASDMIQSLIKSGSLDKPGGGRYVVTTGRVVNDTMQRIDTDQLMAKIEQDLMNSGMIVMTSAVGGKGASDEMVYQIREIRESGNSDEFAADTLPEKRQIVAPELSISGKILQRNVTYTKNVQQVEYYFQLRVTDINTGLRFWQNEKILGKRGSDKHVPW